MIIDEGLPVYDVSDAVATVVDAGVKTTWDALMEVDLLDVGRRHPAVAVLGAIRALPDVIDRLLRHRPMNRPARLRLGDLTKLPLDQGGWVLLGERPDDEIAFGLVGKFWMPIIEFESVTAEQFRDFARPGFAKTIYSLAVRPVNASRTLLTGAMRTATTDQHARMWFRRYWTFGVGAGAHVLVNGLLDVAREAAEEKTNPVIAAM